jgi:hypothetical protein
MRRLLPGITFVRWWAAHIRKGRTCDGCKTLSPWHSCHLRECVAAATVCLNLYVPHDQLRRAMESEFCVREVLHAHDVRDRETLYVLLSLCTTTARPTQNP